jgi:legumain
MPASNIITFYYNDVANDPQNPFPGKIFNAPTAAGVPGVDVYAGCANDYQQNDVTPQNFINVITGNSLAMKGVGTGRVLTSGPNDHVFINFVDHGAPGLIAFPSDELDAPTLMAALNQMHKTNMYHQLSFYLESCESGSMFDGILPTNISIYATTAANPGESSYGAYCDPADTVDGTEIGSCLGDLYSVSWMENVDSVGYIGIYYGKKKSFSVF